MNLNNYSKESVTLGFYIFYITITYLFYVLFPGDEKTPNFGIVFMFLLIPISLAYASFQAYKHFNSTKSYFKCLLIHTAAWFSIITYLTTIAK
jgi:hypothetical protein